MERTSDGTRYTSSDGFMMEAYRKGDATRFFLCSRKFIAECTFDESTSEDERHEMEYRYAEMMHSVFQGANGDYSTNEIGANDI